MSERIPIAWAEVRKRLEPARSYWICTASAAGGPHAMPVWGVWVDGRLWFSTGPQTLKARDLAADPRVAVHLENASDLVSLRGRAEEVPAGEVPAEVDAAYAAKYVMPRTGEAAPITVRDSRVFAVTPVTGHSWYEGAFIESMTRWRFGEPGQDPVAEEIGYGG
ncbi:MAG: hypothetical protein QOF44_969 [Streptomyces sp.]|jgi:hypothetical protein|nr:hypothetical protein [Streptomyces sp.]